MFGYWVGWPWVFFHIYSALCYGRVVDGVGAT
jgi:hypothetical protein